MAATGIEAFLDAVQNSPDLELHSLMLLRHGQLVAEGWWAPYERADAPLLYSLSKSFTSTALGFAVAEGLLGLDDPVVGHLAPTGPVGPRTRAITSAEPSRDVHRAPARRPRAGRPGQRR